MNKQKMKLITIYSLILGAFLGLIGLIPYVYIYAFSVIVMSVISSIVVVIYMEQKQQIGELTIKGGAILGAYIGFISMIGYGIINLPINAIFGLIFNYYTPASGLISIWWLLIIMGGLITGLFNLFSLVAYVYIKDTFFMIEGKKEVKPIFEPRSRKDGF